jgi:hypothetical protein
MISEDNLVKPDAWRQLVKEHWGNTPALFKAACSPEVFAPSTVLETLQTAREELEQGKSVNLSLYDKDNICRSAASHSSRANCGLAPLLPTPIDRVLEAYLTRLSTVRGLEHFTLFLDRPNQLNANIWLTMRALLTEFYRESEVPSQSVGADIFIGNYKATPFGVHKDELHNFMFMAQGRRVMHFWPDRAGDKVADETRKISYEVEPGDMLYWPPDYWHVGESNGDTAISINIDLWENKSSQWAKQSVVDALGAVASPIAEMLAKRFQITIEGKGYPQLAGDPTQGAQDLQQLATKVAASIKGPMLDLNLSKAWIARLSSAAMDVPVPRRTPAGIKPDDYYRICHRVVLPSLSCSGKYLLACNGHVIAKTDAPGWREIAAHICTGEPFTPVQLLSTKYNTDINAICEFLEELQECRGIEPAASDIRRHVSA